jgi:hypothetical protein
VFKPVTLFSLLAAAVVVLHLGARVSVDVYPRVVMAPASVRVIAKVTPHPDNRLLRISLDCPNFYDATEIELEGLNAPITHGASGDRGVIEGIPAGECEVLAQVVTADGKVIQSTAVTLIVAGGEPDAR